MDLIVSVEVPADSAHRAEALPMTRRIPNLGNGAAQETLSGQRDFYRVAVMPDVKSLGRRSIVHPRIVAMAIGLISGSAAAIVTFVSALALVPAVRCPTRCAGLNCSLIGCVVDFRGQAAAAALVGLVVCSLTILLSRRLRHSE
jgi:hypothetical protein